MDYISLKFPKDDSGKIGFKKMDKVIASLELLDKLYEINTKITSNSDLFDLKLASFLQENQKNLSQENRGDLNKIQEVNLFLKQETSKFLNKKNLEEKNHDDFAKYLTKVRHDLRNLINVIKGYVEIIIEEFQKHESMRSYLHEIEEISTISNSILISINEIKFQPDFKNYFVPFEEKKKDSIEISKQGPKSKEFLTFKENFSILIVDDVKENCILLERYLNRIGHKNIHSVQDGFQALALVKKYDLMLLDIDMPHMNGIQVLKKVKEEIIAGKLMVIMISVADTLENLIESIKLGANDFLIKPFNPDILQVRIDSCIEKSWGIHQENVFRQRIEFEHQRYENLLHSIFPPAVVQEFIQKGFIETRIYKNVAILFADVVDFTLYCDNHEPEEIRKSLQEFTALCEAAAAQNNLQKIKTVGDSFLGVAGMLMKSENPVLDCIKYGQELIRESEKLASQWKLHVGINYGTAIGGIVGHRQYLFDVFGDTVNTAANVQSISQPNSVYLSKEAWNQVSGICKGQSLGEIKIKGKNPLEIFICEEVIESK